VGKHVRGQFAGCCGSAPRSAAASTGCRWQATVVEAGVEFDGQALRTYSAAILVEAEVEIARVGVVEMEPRQACRGEPLRRGYVDGLRGGGVQPIEGYGQYDGVDGLLRP
jgi:hypothetical protein